MTSGVKYSLVGYVGIDENKLHKLHSKQSTHVQPNARTHINFDKTQYDAKYDGAAYESHMHTGDVIIGIGYMNQEVVAEVVTDGSSTSSSTSSNGSGNTIGAVSIVVSVSEELSLDEWDNIVQSWDLMPTARSSVTVMVAR